jgi:hypothetical protein
MDNAEDYATALQEQDNKGSINSLIEVNRSIEPGVSKSLTGIKRIGLMNYASEEGVCVWEVYGVGAGNMLLNATLDKLWSDGKGATTVAAAVVIEAKGASQPALRVKGEGTRVEETAAKVARTEKRASCVANAVAAKKAKTDDRISTQPVGLSRGGNLQRKKQAVTPAVAAPARAATTMAVAGAQIAKPFPEREMARAPVPATRLGRGWARKPKKSNTRYTDEQNAMLDKLFKQQNPKLNEFQAHEIFKEHFRRPLVLKP